MVPEDKRDKLNIKFVKYKDALQMYPVCEKTLRKLVNDAGAKYKIGRAVMINTEIMDEFMENFHEKRC